MISTDKFFEAFSRAGFLKAISWTPSAGGATQTAQARFYTPDQVLLDVMTPEYSIVYPSSQLVGLKSGEAITVAGVSYTVKEKPKKTGDGTLTRAPLSKV